MADHAPGNRLVEACTADRVGKVCNKKTDYAQILDRPCPKPLQTLLAAWHAAWHTVTDPPLNGSSGRLFVSESLCTFAPVMVKAIVFDLGGVLIDLDFDR